jgi:chaperonin GroES
VKVAEEQRVAVGFKPLGDRLLVSPIPEDEVLASGIVLPQNARDRPLRAKVLAVGPGTTHSDGTILPIPVEAGQVVLFSRYGGTEIILGGEEYLVLRQSDVLGIIEEG